jgi:uncharacterized protein with HEPN domain
VVPRSQLIRLSDILENINAATEMIEGVDFSAYRNDVMLRRAIERCVEIISEASRHIPTELKLEYDTQPWHEIASIGNLLRHHYERMMTSSCGRLPRNHFRNSGRLSLR